MNKGLNSRPASSSNAKCFRDGGYRAEPPCKDRAPRPRLSDVGQSGRSVFAPANTKEVGGGQFERPNSSRVGMARFGLTRSARKRRPLFSAANQRQSIDRSEQRVPRRLEM